MTDLNAPFNPDWSSPPGDTIFDILQERGITQEQLAQALRLTRREVAELLSGTKRITLGLAHNLSSFLGASPESWIKRDYYYCEKVGILDQFKVRMRPKRLSFDDPNIERYWDK